MKKYFITGGAGFIGSQLARRLLQNNNYVTVYDNLINGRLWHLDEFKDHANLKLLVGDVKDQELLMKSLEAHDAVYHLASNADIARAATNPDIDFIEGTFLTRCILEAMRLCNVNEIYYTSGSGVYGEVPPIPIPENWSPMIPVSTYGAQKLASESLIASYSFMFGIKARIFRFANVVGPRQTHGVAYDFIKKLLVDNKNLVILGDGSQTKPYIHIHDILNAITNIFSYEGKGQSDLFNYYNVGTQDSLTVNEIAEIICVKMRLNNVKFDYTGGARGWKADVPIYKLDTSKLRSMGWDTKFNSREAVSSAVDSMIEETREGKNIFGVNHD